MTEKNKKEGIQAGNGSIVIGGNVEGSNIVMGNNNNISNQRIQLAPQFEIILTTVEKSPTLTPAEKEDVKAELIEIKTALEEPEPDENFLARRFRTVKRMAPDIVEVAFETLKNPIGGVAEVIKKVSKKMAEDAKS